MIDTNSATFKTNKALGLDGHPWAVNAVVPIHIWHQIQTALVQAEGKNVQGPFITRERD